MKIPKQPYRSYWQTTYPNAIQLPTLDKDIKADVCIIGLGGSGLSGIYTALEKGLSVVGIDANNIASGAAGCNGGFVLAGTYDYHHNAREKFGRDVACEWRKGTLKTLEWMQKTSPNSFNIAGSIRIATSEIEDEDCEHYYDAMQEDGFRCEWYTGSERLKNENGEFRKALLFPDNGVFNPFVRCQQMTQRCLDGGAQLFSNTTALNIESGRVETNHGVIEAERILVCVDGNLTKLFPELESEVTTWRLQMLATEPVQKLTDKAVSQRDGYDYWQQLSNGQILLGGGRDKGGQPESTDSVETSARVQDYLDSFVTNCFGQHVSIVKRWAATVSYTQTGLPIYREMHPDVWAMGAYCGTGNVVGSMLARRALLT